MLANFRNINLIIAFLFAISSCSDKTLVDNNEEFESTTGDWLVPFSEIVDSGGGKESIRSINNPSFLEASNPANAYLHDDDLIVGAIKSGNAKAYPYKILNFHEIVNDRGITINYCPLTGTTFGWNNSSSEFGVSGLLYKDNLILFDRKTDSYWSQLLLQSIHGERITEEAIAESIVETNWKTWKKLYPNTLVLKGTTEQTSNNNPFNNFFSGRERLYSIINKEGVSRIYSTNMFSEGKAIKDTFDNKTYVVVGDKNLIISFELDDTTKDLEFTYNFDNGTSFFKDNEGNEWNIFGLAVSGSRLNNKLKKTTNVLGFKSAIDDFYPNAVSYSN